MVAPADRNVHGATVEWHRCTDPYLAKCILDKSRSLTAPELDGTLVSPCDDAELDIALRQANVPTEDPNPPFIQNP